MSYLPPGSGPERRRRVAIVGAGPGGLAAAMLLAREGLQVTLLEKSDAVGGRTRTVTPEGFRFDLGPTFFLYPQILESVFDRCGLSLQDYVTLKRVDPSYRLAFENGPDVRIGGDLDNLETEIARLDAGDARNIRRFIEANRTKLRDFTPILQRPFLNLVDYLAPSVVKALRHLAPPASVDADLTRYFRDPAFVWPFRSRRNISACRRSAVRACSPSWLFSNTSSASGTRSAAAAP